MVSALSAPQRLMLGQVTVAEKSNMITATSKLLDLLTTDAMGYQRRIAREVVNRGADYALSLQANQGRCERRPNCAAANRKLAASPGQRPTWTRPLMAITGASKRGQRLL